MMSMPPVRWKAPSTPASGQTLKVGFSSVSGEDASEQFQTHMAANNRQKDFKKGNFIHTSKKPPKHRTKDINKIPLFK
jgi:hypothetical protein